MTGPAERGLDRLGRRYAGVCRAVVAVGCGALGMLLVPAPERVWGWLEFVVLCFWSVGYGLLILRTAMVWPVLADLTFICVFALLQAQTVPTSSISDGSGWIFAMVSMTVVTYQWHTSVRVGVGASVILVAVYIVSTQEQLRGISVGWLSTALWVIAEAALSRGLIMLVRRGGRISDNYLAERERVEQLTALSRARRSDELEYLADLHDTAAATFLMVGAGTVSGREPWLAEQARRDLRVLRGDNLGAQAGAVMDLETMLTELLTGIRAEIGLTVEYNLAGRTDSNGAGDWNSVSAASPAIRLPAGPAEAMCDSVREALVNVQRHAGTGQATVTMTGSSRLVSRAAGGQLLVEVRDAGVGFDMARVSPHRRGIGESITARMSRAGGRASIVSAPGQGTLVRLVWPDD